MLVRYFIFLLVLGLLFHVLEGRRRKNRRKCPPGWNLSRTCPKSSPCCTDGRTTTVGWGNNGGWTKEVWRMKEVLERKLGKTVDIPCYDGSVTEQTDSEGVIRFTIYCEVCFTTDSNRISCDKSVIKSDACGGPKWEKPKITGVFHQNYADGTICDCGSALLLKYSYKPGDPSKEASVYTPASPSQGLEAQIAMGDGTSSIQTETWGWRFFINKGLKYIPLPLPGPVISCRSRPDISSIFQSASSS